MTSNSVLVVEDEPDVRELLNFTLGRVGFDVHLAADAEEALRMLAIRLPDLILIDWMLPGLSGVDLARHLRRDESTATLPLIMLTARSDEDDKLRSFDVGIDDYVTKPFSSKELVARIRALIRRSSGKNEGSITVSGLTLDTVAHSVSCEGTTVHLRPMEYRLLELFLTHPKRAFYRSQLLDMLWGRTVFVDERTVDVHILRLRKALAPFNMDNLVQTVRGVGYRFAPMHG